MKIIVENEQQTTALAAKLAPCLPGHGLICLRGDLGAGKTSFARALVRTLCEDETMDVPSPTFTLVQNYDTRQGALWHFDLYRLENPEEIYELGWEDALADGLALVEWPEKAENLIPPDRLEITLSPLAGNPNHREIRMVSHGTFPTVTESLL